ncbi:Dual specificity protein phosphatase 13 isoform B [Orchesella cincta]|uniref:Dual specificity protein phosphatase n=1 Tax=Orchesella cincta TaxID=48709 RepID=A0A1D2NLI8_ORCCI|nr:Dual specificity protein phosphatase 13 isoform B [Orchesella cincta]
MSKEEVRIQVKKVLENESVSHWNHLDQVYPGIFIGDEHAAKDIDNLKRLGITHILNAAFVSSRTNCYDHGIVDTDPDWYAVREYNCEFLGIDAIDNPEFDLSQFFEDAADFIESARCSNGMVSTY